MTMSAAQSRDVISFGPFSLVASERRLMKDGAPLELGARSLDLLIALLARPNEVVSKRDLLAQVWPDVTVEEGSLRFHIAGLRKALGDGKNGARYITTLAGRGYCFVAPVSRSSERAPAQLPIATGVTHTNLPNRLLRMVGRADDVAAIATQLTSARFVTIVGAGGVGKSTVAAAVGHDLVEAFAGHVMFVDLGMVNDPALVATVVASMLGLSVQSDDATPGLLAYLRDQRGLLILDTCEHVIEAVAALAERIVAAAPQAHILATSREALRVEGEHVYRLEALACPPDDAGLTAAAAQTFPAVQLFLERAAASGARLELTDTDAAIVAGICRKLDGVALAIELAARRVDAYGLGQTAALLDQRLALLWQGPRTAPPRQKTLQATLDWSYELLSDLERVMLRRLAMFVGHFTIDAALAIVASADLDRARVFGAIDSLVAKSMVATRPLGAMMRYRLLDATRAYALARSDDAERAELGARHADHFQRWLEETVATWPILSNTAERSAHFAGLNNVRAALEWCFGPGGDRARGVRLAAAAAPVFLAMSLLPECQRWSERALGALDAAACGGREEMQLQAGIGMSLMFTRGATTGALAALNRSLAIAEARGDALDQLQLLGPLQMFHLRTADFSTALHYARRGAAVAATIADPSACALAHALEGLSLHLIGDLAGARTQLAAALALAPRSGRGRPSYLGFEGRNLAEVFLARTLWLQGHPEEALSLARRTIADAARFDHPVTLSVALVWGISVFLWAGDLASADEHVDWFVSRAAIHALTPYLAVGCGFKGELAIHRGDAQAGVESLQSCLHDLRGARHELLATPFNIALAQGLAALGRRDAAIALIDRTIAQVAANGDAVYMPELLRLKGSILLALPQPDGAQAEACFMQSLAVSRDQGARAWELRTGIDLAALLAARGDRDGARTQLQPIIAQFAEDPDTADLQAAARLLASLG